jgi:hypothetical protein
MALKIAVFAPIPRPSIATATRVNPGDLRNVLHENLRSWRMVSMVAPVPVVSGVSRIQIT